MKSKPVLSEVMEQRKDLFKEVTPEQLLTAKLRGIEKNNVRSRLKSGLYTIEEALTLPVNTRRGKKKSDAFTEEEFQRAFKNGITRPVAIKRFESGATKEQAINEPCHSQFLAEGRKKEKAVKELQKSEMLEIELSKSEDKIDKLMEALDYYAEGEDGEVARKALESMS